MTINEVGGKHKYYYKYSKNINNSLDGDANILEVMMSKVIFTTTNPFLQGFLSNINKGLRFLMKYAKRLKDFKNYLKYNR